MLLLALAATALTPGRMPPIDECASDNSFVEFRAALKRTVKQGNAKALLEIVADDVQASLGGDLGKKDFVKLWKLAEPGRSEIWRELGDALSLGCSLRSGVATVPAFKGQIGADRDA